MAFQRLRIWNLYLMIQKVWNKHHNKEISWWPNPTPLTCIRNHLKVSVFSLMFCKTSKRLLKLELLQLWKILSMIINHRLKSYLNSKLGINHWINCKTGQLSDIDTPTWLLRISMLQFHQWIKIKTKGWIHKTVRKIQAWIDLKLTDKAIKELYSLLRGIRWTLANKLVMELPDTWATSIRHNNHQQ